MRLIHRIGGALGQIVLRLACAVMPLLGEAAVAAPLEIAAWGDSLTRGKGVTDESQSYPAVACRMIGDCVAFNLGWGGQDSTQIAARQGGVPLVIRVAGGEIPAQPVPVAVLDRSVDVLWMAGRSRGSLEGSLAGVAGILATDAAGRWSFTRAAPGAAVTVPDPVVFLPADAFARREAETWIWAGRNNIRDADQVMADIAAMVDALGHDRFLVGEILPSVEDRPGQVAARRAVNARLAAIYGPRFVPLVAALQQAGDGSAQDAADIARGDIPSSLRFDHLHLNAAGYAIVAQQFVATLAARR
ncbi:hypothetical protein SAMN04488103_101436 [Gemmobacter aquatilis]|uniref:GDSL-like Lipase/Acylhydrolase family protein n=1 Tax=Gemmobacter aquatilis TaxID=933059 RepID=A0A1H7ZAU5_9RHOB|nr:hypothetical protein [Gemmobacter aquatilis]SEM54599.1 hypothetical protein SAMN04488103_101436 [Gemmobacter aquatilis]